MNTATDTTTGREYLRVSQDRDGRGKSPDQQHHENEQTFPGSLGDPYRDDNRSASRYARKVREDFSRLLTDLENGRFGADALVLWESSRGSRTVGEWVALLDLCERQGVRVWVTTHGRLYDPANARDRRTLLEDAVDSEYESAKTSARNRRNTKDNALTGKPHGRVLYGYRREYDYDGRGNRQLRAQVERSDQARIVREAARRIASGESCYGVAKDLNRREVPIPHKPSNERNRPEWNGAQVKRMVTNPGYIGKRVHQGQIVGDAAWPPLLDEETFYICERILNDPARKQSRDGAVQHLLTGIAVCGVCERIMRTGRQNNGGTPYKTYICKEFHTSRRCSYLDDYISDLVIERMSMPDLLDVLNQQAPDERGVRGQIAEKRARLTELESLATAGEVSFAAFSRMEKTLLSELDILERERARATVSPAVASVMGPDAQDRWDAAGLPQQREIVRSLFWEITVHPIPAADRGKRGFDRRLIEWEWSS